MKEGENDAFLGSDTSYSLSVSSPTMGRYRDDEKSSLSTEKTNDIDAIADQERRIKTYISTTNDITSFSSSSSSSKLAILVIVAVLLLFMMSIMTPKGSTASVGNSTVPSNSIMHQQQPTSSSASMLNSTNQTIPYPPYSSTTTSSSPPPTSSAQSSTSSPVFMHYNFGFSNVSNALGVRSSLSIFDRYKERIKGSELDQLIHWIDFTNLGVNESAKLFSVVGNVDTEEKLSKLFPGDPLFNQIPALWRPTNTSAHSHRMLSPDCSYRITSIKEIVECRENSVNLLDPFCNLNFLVEQSDCASDKDPNSAAKRLGGSSFEIGFASSFSAISCTVLDNYDNTYWSLCDFPMSMFGITDEKKRRGSTLQHMSTTYQPSYAENIYCLDVNATLSYEHFDAFSEQKFRGLKMRHNFLKVSDPIIKSGGSRFCYQINELLLNAFFLTK